MIPINEMNLIDDRGLKLIRDFTDNPRFVLGTKDRGEFIDLLNQMDRYSGIIYRGMYRVEDNKFQVGSTWSSDDPMSWSKDRQVAIDILSTRGFDNSVLLKVKSSKYGVDLEPYVKVPYKKDQQEVVTVANARFEVVDKKEFDRFNLIELKEK